MFSAVQGAPTEGTGAAGHPRSSNTKTDQRIRRTVPRAGTAVKLRESDVNPKEPSIGELEGVKVWVWHTGVYSGGGKWIVGDHFAGQAVETDLAAYLAEHADTYSGVFVTRPKPKAVRPTRCRKHAPL